MSATADVLVVAAHPDDEVLGCGGTIARLAAEGRAVHVVLLADGESSRPVSPDQLNPDQLRARHAAATTACEILGVSVTMRQLPDNRLDTVPLLNIVKMIEEDINRLRPATIFTHHGGDVNVDHRIVHEAVLAACRPQPGHPVKDLYLFEIASSTEWRTPGSGCGFEPNRFVDIDATLQVKLRALEAYGAEMRAFPHPRSLRAVEALARWRGATVGVHAAEAFMVGRQIR